jgi:hypothetical protein
MFARRSPWWAFPIVVCLAGLPFSCDETGEIPEDVRCQGIARACDTFATPAECATQAGCGNPSSCAGVATACADLAYDDVCAAHSGCRWVPVCMGEPMRCENYFVEDVCHLLLGCTWDPGTRLCSGTAWECARLTVERCEEQPGCRIGGRCEGEATACGSYAAEPACLGQFGCEWNVGPCAGTAVSCEELSPDVCAWQWGCEAL